MRSEFQSSGKPSDPEGRRSRVTLLFSDLCDYTALTEAMDPEEADAVRRRVEAVTDAILKKHGGAINQVYGDGILAVFGYPTTDEESVRRAVNAALELREATRELTWTDAKGSISRLSVHSGIHSGLVFVRGGDAVHGRYELTGDAVNTASRLCSVARRDEILVSVSTLRGHEAFFATETLPPLELKGKVRPVLAYRVLGSSPVESRFEARFQRGFSAFVGRTLELEQLERALESTRRGGGRALCLVGDGGIGKTRLLREFSWTLRDSAVPVYEGRCETYGSAPPLHPFLQILQKLLPVPTEASPASAAQAVEARLSQIDEPLRERLSVFLHLLAVKPWPPAAAIDDQRQEAVLSALTSLIGSLGNHGPCVVILDDWQWADDASTQVLGRLLHDAPKHGVLLLLGSRAVAADDPVLGAAELVRLRPFDEQESLHAIRGFLRWDLDTNRAFVMHRRSGGNPLFLEELCQSFAGVENFGEAPPSEVPGSVHGLIQARVERLAGPELALLRTASVIGNEAPLWLFDQVSSDPARCLRLSALVAKNLLEGTEDPEVFRFRHGILRDVVYESVRLDERRSLHRAIADAIDARYRERGLSEHYESLAFHYHGAGESVKTAEFAELAGDKAALTSALDRARLQYRRTLDALDCQSQTVEVRRRWLHVSAKWAAACVFNPSREELRVLARAADSARELGDQGALGHAQYWLGWIHYALGEQARAIEQFESALAIAEAAQHPKLMAQLLSNLGQSHAAAGDSVKALAYLDRSIDLKRRHVVDRKRVRVPVGFVYALGCKAVVRADAGEFAAAHVHIQEALDIVRDSRHAVEGSLLGLLGMIEIWQGRWQQAVRTAARARDTAERVNGPYVFAMSQSIEGYARFALSRSEAFDDPRRGLDQRQSLEQLQRAVEWLDTRSIRLFASFNYAHLADVLLQSEHFGPARDFAERALARAQQSDPLGEAMAHRTLAELHGTSSRERALPHIKAAFRAAETRASKREHALCQLVLAELHSVWGDRPLARGLFDQAQTAFTEMGMTAHDHRARHGLTALGS